jgi:hypothetical protein
MSTTTRRRAVAHNSLQNFMQKYTHPFTVEPAFIDCKEMSKNYPNGLIPLTDIANAVDSVFLDQSGGERIRAARRRSFLFLWRRRRRH